MKTNTALQGTDCVSVNSATLGTDPTSLPITLLETDSSGKPQSYNLTETPVTISSIVQDGKFNLEFTGVSDITALSLELTATGSTSMNGSPQGWSGADNTYYYSHSGMAATINISFSEDNAEIIIVGTVPTDPEDPKDPK